MTPARLAAQCVDLLGPVEGPLDSTDAPALAAWLATGRDGAHPVAAVCDFRGERADPAAREARLAAVANRLPAGAKVVVVDHNQPRAWWRRAVGMLVLAAHGVPPARARYPVAREAHAVGFAIDRLRLAAGERVQLVLARRR